MGLEDILDWWVIISLAIVIIMLLLLFALMNRPRPPD